MQTASNIDPIATALREVIAEQGLTRLDIGAYTNRATVTIWYDGGQHGCSHGSGNTVDAALVDALQHKADQLGRPVLAVAA